MQGAAEIIRLFQLVSELTQGFGNNCIQDDVGIGNGGGRTQRTEFELVARKGKRRGPVPVCCIAGEFRQRVYTDSKLCFFPPTVACSGFKCVKDFGQFITEENTDNRRWGFAASETVIIAWEARRRS